MAGTRLDVSSPNRLVMELRLAQFASLLLVLAAGIYVGLAVAHESSAGVGVDIALAIGFFVVAALATRLQGNGLDRLLRI